MTNKNQPTWQTKEGKVIYIKDMSDRHLINAIKYLERNVENYRQSAIKSGYSILFSLQGKQAQLEVENGINRYENATRMELLNEMGFDLLFTELKRRKLYV